jgi:para-aminobenzoate synthetase component 1
MAIGIYDWALVLDHQQKTARLVSHLRYAETEILLKQIFHRLQTGVPPYQDHFRVMGDISSNFSRATYQNAFDIVQGYLQDGDCYQVNLAQRFSAKAVGDAFGAYLELRQRSPAPYSAFLNLPKIQILCASPERFLHMHKGHVETKPIKGTRPRDGDSARDRQLADELREHPKDRAENLMIVDLLRNDLGKSCQPGSVRVPKLFEVESYTNVHHLVSTVEGKLAAGRDALDILSDCFPGGSITGAPKQRAMEIIEQIEPYRRGAYCGTIGYIGFDGNMDTNIIIRTLFYSENEIRCWAGGGIVADSQSLAEYQETLDKASVMLSLLRHYGGHDGTEVSLRK